MKLVVHCKVEPYDVYIGRGSKWGNPFKIGVDGDRDEVIDKYAEWLFEQPELVKEAQTILRGKVLGCWCSPKACHGDILAEVANPRFPIKLFDTAWYYPDEDILSRWITEEVETWIADNIEGGWSFSGGVYTDRNGQPHYSHQATIWFDEAKDALKFKLVWGSDDD